MIPGREEAQRLVREAESCNPGPWGDHSRVAADLLDCSILRVIASQCAHWRGNLQQRGVMPEKPINIENSECTMLIGAGIERSAVLEIATGLMALAMTESAKRERHTGRSLQKRMDKSYCLLP